MEGGGGFRGGFRGWEAGERKEGSGEITRLGPCEILQARHGGAEVAATAPKGSAGEKRGFYGPLNRRMLRGENSSRRRFPRDIR